MGENFDGQIRFGVLVPEDHCYKNYDPMGANLEQDSEWQSYETAKEAFEAHAEQLTKESNLTLITVGHYKFPRFALVLEAPYVVETGYSDDYWATKFDPKKLDAGDPRMHIDAIQIAKKLSLDWGLAAWLLTWSVG